ncbi:MAG: response regulator [Planctomycetes bacterium]|nr:response regulator [Planctomycetota bacterium]
MKKKFILCVDDDQLILNSMVRCLGKAKYVTITAHNSKEALELADYYNFDAVIIDIMMPEVSGLQLMNQLKELHPTLPIVIVTGLQDDDTLFNSVKLGCNGFVEKPFEPEWLLTQLESAISISAKTMRTQIQT